jgi:hypothetical protein
LALRQMASEVMVRGVMIQQGALKACIDISSHKESDQTTRNPSEKLEIKAHREAAWCIGKLLITTNPSILTSAQRLGSVLPLLQLCKVT